MAYYNRGGTRSKTGEIDGALADYSEAIRLEPDCVAANIEAQFENQKGNTSSHRPHTAQAISLPVRAQAAQTRSHLIPVFVAAGITWLALKSTDLRIL